MQIADVFLLLRRSWAGAVLVAVVSGAFFAREIPRRGRIPLPGADCGRSGGPFRDGPRLRAGGARILEAPARPVLWTENFLKKVLAKGGSFV